MRNKVLTYSQSDIATLSIEKNSDNKTRDIWATMTQAFLTPRQARGIAQQLLLLTDNADVLNGDA